MEIIELYDGESRSKIWWKVILRHTIGLALLSPFAFLLLLYAFNLEFGGIGISGLIQYWLLVSLTSWPILFGISMVFPRFSFSLYYWNGWLLLILLVPASVASTIVAQVIRNNSTVPFIIFIGTYVIGFTFKTLILYRRFTIAASEKGKQKLPT